MASAAPTPQSNPALDISFLSLRKAIGWIGILMPWVTRIVSKASGDTTPFLMSISSYYHTAGRDVFVGSLFAAGLFLCFYRGVTNSALDRWLAITGGVACAFIGLIPMNPCGDKVLKCIDPALRTYHFIPVAVFFAVIIFLVLFRFTKSTGLSVTPQKETRNRIYVICGVIMLASVAAIALFDYLEMSVFLPEAAAIATFSVAWLVKGRMIFADK